MSDLEIVRALAHRYVDTICRLDVDAWADTWDEDATWQIGRGPVQGRTAITEAFARAMSLFDQVLQLLHSGDATLDHTTGTGAGRWYFSEYSRTKTGKNLLYLGAYDDTYRLGPDGRWRFASRTLEWLYQGPADLSGTFGPPPGYTR
ncbi:MAG: nuclear transport factor 2 family protein [Acidimicrobiales bacterium]